MGSKHTKNKKISTTNDDTIKVDHLDPAQAKAASNGTANDASHHATSERRRASNGSSSSQNSNGAGSKAAPNASDTEDHDYPPMPMSPAIISTTHLNDTKPDPNAASTTSTRIIYVNSVRHSSLPAYPVDTLLYNQDKENQDPTATATPKRLVPILVNNNNSHANEAAVKGKGLLSNGKDGGGGGLRMLPIIARRRSVATTKILQKEQIETTDPEAPTRPARIAKGVRFSEQVITIDHSPLQQPQADLDDTQLSNDDYLYPNEHYMRRRSSLKEGYLLKKPIETVDELAETGAEPAPAPPTPKPAAVAETTSNASTSNVKSKPLSFN